MADTLPRGIDDEEYQGFVRDQATLMRKYPVWPFDQTVPKEFLPGQGGEASIFQGPVTTLDPANVLDIKGAAAYRSTVRDFMKQAIRERGSAAEGDVIGKILRGTWWHGRKTFPKTDKKLITMEGTRASGTNFGEPIGTSLTSKPGRAGDFSRVYDESHFNNILEMDKGAQKIEEKLMSLSHAHEDTKMIAFEDHLSKLHAGDPNLGGGIGYMSNADTDRANEIFKKGFAPIQAKFDKKEIALTGALDKISKRHTKAKSPDIARMFPDYGGRPEDVIIDSTTRDGGAVMKQHYEETLRQMARSGKYEGNMAYKGAYVEHATSGLDSDAKIVNFTGSTVSLSKIKNYGDLRRLRSKHPTFKDDFNKLFTANLEKSGYRGVLYSPEARFNEYEMKMFPGHSDPSKGSKWAVPVDIRKTGDKSVERFAQSKEKLNEQWVNFVNEQNTSARDPVYNNLEDIYEGVDLEQVFSEFFDSPDTLDMDEDMPF